MRDVLLLVICKFLDPCVAIDFNKPGNTFEKLVEVQAENYRYGRPLKHECRQERKRKHDTPDTYKIILDYKLQY